MSINLANYQAKARDAVKKFWDSRNSAQDKQILAGRTDQGSRGSVTAGKNMDGFVQLIVDLIAANGLLNAEIKQTRNALTLPGFFRPTKLWDLLVVNDGKLIAALEFKSQVGSFGNNFNNRTEEAIGTAVDFWTAYRQGAFGEISKPFLGWMMLVEDAPDSRSPVRDSAPNFPVFAEFQDASYIDRYDVLCKKLMAEHLYTSATVIVSRSDDASTGKFSNVSELTSFETLVRNFADHIATEAERS